MSATSRLAAIVFVGATALSLAACSPLASLPFSAGVGPDPQLPPPPKTIVPTVNIAPAKGWPTGMTPDAAEGTRVAAFAAGLQHPRWLYVLPNGDVLVAESDAPADWGRGIKDWVMGLFMKRAGSGKPSADRITLLRDTDGDGVADIRTPFIEELYSPLGMALVGNDLYVANCDALLRFPYREGVTRIATPGTKVTDLPGAPNHHWTKNILASRDERKLYVTVGSNSNVGEHGIELEEGRAAIWEVDPRTGQKRVYASGMRNPNGLAWEPRTGALWTVVNERDELGSDLVPDYLTAVREGGFYGWPYSYYGQHVDGRVTSQRPDLVASAIAPDYALGAHVAALGLAHSDGSSLGSVFGEGMFIGEHGSWNRKPRSGYSVVFVPFKRGRPAGAPIDVLTGFVSPEGEAYGRPVGVAIDKRGALLVADDVGNIVWRLTANSPARQTAAAEGGHGKKAKSKRKGTKKKVKPKRD
ncbi:MAG TPA: sorbosone dehydrogenase family protein [Burkholderiales bacterium]|nr:sorbosone dehydrogenase family protein [Burkholderiales bacterium]